MAHGGVFIVGTNPATPIFPSEISPQTYRSLICSAAQFEPVYATIRRKREQPEDGRTRQGLRSLSNWFLSQGVAGVLETNVIPFPTKDEAALRLVSRERQSHWVFQEICETFRPSLIVLHGKPAKDAFIDIVAPTRLAWARDVSVGELERRLEPLTAGQWTPRDPYGVFVCRHLMYYGERGNSYEPFRRAVQPYLSRGSGV